MKPPRRLLTWPQGNTKISKGLIPTYSLFLAPDTVAGGRTVCPKASDGCRLACLNTAGKGTFTTVQQGRIRKTLALHADRDAFYAQLAKEINLAIKRHGVTNRHKTPRIAFRLNGTSDLPHLAQCFVRGHWWDEKVYRFDYEGILNAVLNRLPKGVIFYDYTAVPSYEEVARLASQKSSGARYHVTFSRKENNEAQWRAVMAEGGNVAVVFRGRIPERWEGFQVINGDVNDERWTDPENVIVGLKAKGKAKHDQTGFVVDV